MEQSRMTTPAVHMLDLDGTVVPECAWVFLVGAAASVPFVFEHPVLLLLAFVCLLVPVRPMQLPESEYPVFVNTARPWPLVSPVTLGCLGVPFHRVYFRCAWEKPTSKILNLRKIQAVTGARRLVLYDNNRRICAAVREAGFDAVEADYAP